MVARQLVQRQGGRLASVVSHSHRLWRRGYASEVDTLEKSIDNLATETQSIEGLVQSTSSKPVPRYNRWSNQRLDPSSLQLAEKYKILQFHNETTAGYGATVGDYHKPQQLVSNPPSPADITPELLLASQAHLGHSTSLWNPMNSRYIHGVRDGIHIISLEETAAHLRRACRITRGVTERGGLILFVGTRQGQERAVTLAAKNAGGCHVFERWTPGSITNKQQILGGRGRIKVVNEFDQEIDLNKDALQDIPALVPDLVVCLNPKENWVLLNECSLYNVPTIGVIDTDADPTWVTYPIPANDDSLRCISVIAGVLGKAAQEGQILRQANANAGVVLYDRCRLPDDENLYDTSGFESGSTRDLPTEYRDSDGNIMTPQQVNQIKEENDALLDADDNWAWKRGPDGNLVKMYEDKSAEAQYEMLLERSGGPLRRGVPEFDIESEQETQSPSLVEQDRREIQASDILGEDRAILQAEEELAQAEEDDRIHAANKIPDDGRQRRLDEEKRSKSH